jgi:DNA-binding response OmpR family regulator
MLAPTELIRKVDELEINQHRWQVKVKNKRKKLTATEFRLLWKIYEFPGWVISRDSLITAMKDEKYCITDRTIDTHICAIRRKIGHQFIETVRGVGYRAMEG